MANYNVSTYADIVNAINTANGTTANDNLIFQNDITLTAQQTLDLFNIPANAGTLRFRSQQPTPAPTEPVVFKLIVDSSLNIVDNTPATAQPSFTIGPFALQIGNGGETGGLSGNLRADDGGVLIFDRSVNTTYTGTFSVEEDDNALLNDFAGTTVTFDGTQGTMGLAIRASQGTGAASRYNLDIGGDGDGVVSGIIGDGGLATAAGNLTKVGDGTWTFSGANTYVGLTTVDEGTLVVSNASGLGAAIGGGAGATAAAAGTVVSSGATLALTGGITIASEALTISGAGVVDGTETSGALQNLSGANTYGGPITLAADALISSAAGTLTLTGGIGGAHVLTIGGDGDGVIDQAGSGAGIGSDVTGLVKDGEGTWTLNDVSTFAGPTTVNEGTLQVDGSIANSAVIVKDGGVLAGVGTVGAVEVAEGGTIAAGDDGVGSLTTGGLTLAAGSTFAVEIGGANDGQYDHLTVNGAVDLGDAGIDITLVNGYEAVLGDTFTLVSNDGADAVSDEFDDVGEGEVILSHGHSYQISYVGGDGNDITVTLVNQDPTANDDALAVAQRTTQAGNVITGGTPDTDPENGALTVSQIEFGSTTLAVDLTAPVSVDGDYGTLTINADGSYTYFADVEGTIAVGDTATDTFEYTIVDPDGGESEAELVVTVTGSAIGTAGHNEFLLTGSGTVARGLGGDDTYTVDSRTDQVIEAVGGGDDTVLTSVSYALYGSAAVEHLATTDATGTDAINLTGNKFDNEITGNAGVNLLNGGAGADTLIGLEGNDRYIVTAGDVVVEGLDGGTDTVYASTDFALGDNVEIIRAYHAGATGLSLTGNALDNYLFGGDGVDTLIGGDGADKYFVSAGDHVVEAAGEGVDTVYAGVDFALSDNVERLVAYGAGGGSGLKLTGNSGSNVIVGGAGDDTITGGGGADKLYGMGGDDTFKFDSLSDSNPGVYDRVYGFVAGHDTIDVSSIQAVAGATTDQAFHWIDDAAFSHTAGELHQSFSGANTLIEGDVNGDGRADFRVLLTGHVTLAETDFVL